MPSPRRSSVAAVAAELLEHRAPASLVAFADLAALGLVRLAAAMTLAGDLLEHLGELRVVEPDPVRSAPIELGSRLLDFILEHDAQLALHHQHRAVRAATRAELVILVLERRRDARQVVNPEREILDRHHDPVACIADLARLKRAQRRLARRTDQLRVAIRVTHARSRTRVACTSAPSATASPRA